MNVKCYNDIKYGIHDHFANKIRYLQHTVYIDEKISHENAIPASRCFNSKHSGVVPKPFMNQAFSKAIVRP